ncbi:LysR family transcriptional regulator [Sphingomonas sp. MMS24-J45]|uniref:LysR family transcriptional regulator n=1 Tax=Sphingomonas sp. MMS24-J45 TaxID=3238806 RepID=UPI00384F9E5D
MDRFEAIRTLLAAIDGGSLSAASRSLRIPLPTVSRRVSDLEAHLGTQLVIRTSRRLVLTEAGSAYTAAMRQVVEQVAEAERAAAGEYRAPRGELTVTAPIRFGGLHVAPIVHHFLATYPDVSVRLVLSDANVDLIENHVDVAVRIGTLPDSALLAQRVGAVRWVICASPAYLARRGEPTTPAALAEHDCIAFEGLQRYRDWPFGTGTAAQTIAIRPRLSVNTAEAVVAAAVAGVGIARVMSYQASAAVADGDLVPLLQRHASEPRPVHLIHAPQPLIPLKLRAFLDFVAPRLKAELDVIEQRYR